jgi:hypothetical protein
VQIVGDISAAKVKENRKEKKRKEKHDARGTTGHMD